MTANSDGVVTNNITVIATTTTTTVLAVIHITAFVNAVTVSTVTATTVLTIYNGVTVIDYTLLLPYLIFIDIAFRSK